MKYLLYALSLIFLSCKSKTADSHNDVLKNSADEYFASDNHNATAYKMLYMNDYPYILSEKGFWAVGKGGYDFAIHKTIVSYPNFIEHFQTLNQVDSQNGLMITYAFTFHNTKDTIYATYDLKNWIHKQRGRSIYYSEFENNPKYDSIFYQMIDMDPFFRICK